jgi:hypothetical protein
MCPDKEILSEFFDNEVPSPWKEQIESHLAICPSCRATVGVWARFDTVIQAPSAVGGAEERVWEAVSASIDAESSLRSPGLFSGRRAGHGAISRAVRGGFWGRRVSVPVPALAGIMAAACALIVAVPLLVLRGPANPMRSPVRAFAAVETERAQSLQHEAGSVTVIPDENALANPMNAQTATLQDVLRYLGSADSGDFVILQLPDKPFKPAGDPAFVTTVDYKFGKQK